MLQQLSSNTLAANIGPYYTFAMNESLNNRYNMCKLCSYVHY